MVQAHLDPAVGADPAAVEVLEMSDVEEEQVPSRFDSADEPLGTEPGDMEGCGGPVQSARWPMQRYSGPAELGGWERAELPL